MDAFAEYIQLLKLTHEEVSVYLGLLTGKWPNYSGTSVFITEMTRNEGNKKTELQLSHHIRVGKLQIAVSHSETIIKR